MKEEKIYERVELAEQTIKLLCEKYPEILWRIRDGKIAVLGITNKERGEKSKTLFRVSPVKGAQKALNIIYHVPISYIIEIFWSDWNVWDMNFREWILFKALLTISEEDGKTIKPDCNDFRIILDVVGVDWEKSTSLPSLTSSPVLFKKELMPAIDQDNTENNDAIEEKEEDKV